MRWRTLFKAIVLACLPAAPAGAQPDEPILADGLDAFSTELERLDRSGDAETIEGVTRALHTPRRRDQEASARIASHPDFRKLVDALSTNSTRLGGAPRAARRLRRTGPGGSAHA
jgi:hypothetical protein